MLQLKFNSKSPNIQNIVQMGRPISTIIVNYCFSYRLTSPRVMIFCRNSVISLALTMALLCPRATKHRQMRVWSTGRWRVFGGVGDGGDGGERWRKVAKGPRADGESRSHGEAASFVPASQVCSRGNCASKVVPPPLERN